MASEATFESAVDHAMRQSLGGDVSLVSRPRVTSATCLNLCLLLAI